MGSCWPVVLPEPRLSVWRGAVYQGAQQNGVQPAAAVLKAAVGQLAGKLKLLLDKWNPQLLPEVSCRGC